MQPFVLFLLTITAQLNDVRKVYKQAIFSSESANILVQKTENQSNATLLAYYGTGLALQAKHSLNPATKLIKAKLAAAKLNTAVSKSTKDLEIRFLRFSFECKVPNIVGISKHTSSDKTFILSHLDKQNPIWNEIKKFLKSCSELTEKEKQKVEAIK